MRILFLLFITMLFVTPSYASSNTIKIGVYLSMTGPVAAWGEPQWRGIQIAHEIKPTINGKNVKLILEDAASNPESAALAVQALANRHIKAIIGPVTTTNALSGLAITEKKHIVDVIPSANGLSLTKNKKFAARVCFTNDIQAKIMAQYIASFPKYKKGIIIEDISQDYSVDLTHFFKKYFEKNKGHTVKIYEINGNENDFSALCSKIKSLHPDFIYMTTYYKATALFARTLRMMGSKTKIFSGSAAATDALIDIGKHYAEGITFTDDFDPKVPITKLSKRFIKLYKKRFHKTPGSAESLAADAYLLLVYEAERVGFDPDKLGHAIRNAYFRGASGIIHIEDGKTYRSVVIRTVNNGKFQPIAIFDPVTPHHP